MDAEIARYDHLAARCEGMNNHPKLRKSAKFSMPFRYGEPDVFRGLPSIARLGNCVGISLECRRPDRQSMGPVIRRHQRNCSLNNLVGGQIIRLQQRLTIP